MISNEIIKRLEKQEERLFSDCKEVANQWRGSLLIFAGLAMAALGSQQNTYAYSLIIFWLIEALFILRIFWLNRSVYNLMLDRHCESPTSEEQERCDLESAEKTHRRIRIYEKLALHLFWTSTILTMLYFILSALGCQI